MSEFEIIPEYVARGFAFGDGYVLSTKPKKKGFVMFCYEKKEMMPYFDGYCGKPFRHNVKKFGDNVMMRYGYPREWKTNLPTSDWSPDQKFSWIAGYLAADGSVSKRCQVTLSSANLGHINCVIERAKEIGITVYSPSVRMRVGYGKTETPLYNSTFKAGSFPSSMLLRSKHKERYMNWKKKCGKVI